MITHIVIFLAGAFCGAIGILIWANADAGYDDWEIVMKERRKDE